MQAIDYQQIVNLCAEIIRLALPIGVIFGLSRVAVNGFLSMVFGKNKVDL